MLSNSTIRKLGVVEASLGKTMRIPNGRREIPPLEPLNHNPWRHRGSDQHIRLLLEHHRTFHSERLPGLSIVTL